MVNDLQPPKPRKSWTSLPDSEWIKIRAAYESDPSRPKPQLLAKLYGIHRTTINNRCRAEGWTRRDSLAIATVKAVESQNNAIVEAATANVTKALTQQLTDSLQPWLEKQKTRHIRAQVKRSAIALKQLDRHIKPDVDLAPKESQFIAKAAETWDNIARRNLGLTDGTVGAGSLNLNILTNHSAVQINPSTGTGTAS